jgi:hypothetical protein
MRVHLRRGDLVARRGPLLVVIARAGVARAQPGATAPVGDSSGAPAQAGNATTSDDDTRDVLGGERATNEAAEPGAEPSSAEPVTGTGRAGVYRDSDQTTVLRSLVVLARSLGKWSLTGSVGVDAVTSASIDVRTSPLLR